MPIGGRTTDVEMNLPATVLVFDFDSGMRIPLLEQFSKPGDQASVAVPKRCREARRALKLNVSCHNRVVIAQEMSKMHLEIKMCHFFTKESFAGLKPLTCGVRRRDIFGTFFEQFLHNALASVADDRANNLSQLVIIEL